MRRQFEKGSVDGLGEQHRGLCAALGKGSVFCGAPCADQERSRRPARKCDKYISRLSFQLM